MLCPCGISWLLKLGGFVLVGYHLLFLGFFCLLFSKDPFVCCQDCAQAGVCMLDCGFVFVI